MRIAGHRVKFPPRPQGGARLAPTRTPRPRFALESRCLPPKILGDPSEKNSEAFFPLLTSAPSPRVQTRIQGHFPLPWGLQGPTPPGLQPDFKRPKRPLPRSRKRARFPLNVCSWRLLTSKTSAHGRMLTFLTKNRFFAKNMCELNTFPVPSIFSQPARVPLPARPLKVHKHALNPEIYGRLH